MTKNLTVNLLPPQYSVVIEVNNGTAIEELYSQKVREESEAEVLIPSRKIVFGSASFNELFGPYTITTKVWE